MPEPTPESAALIARLEAESAKMADLADKARAERPDVPEVPWADDGMAAGFRQAATLAVHYLHGAEAREAYTQRLNGGGDHDARISRSVEGPPPEFKVATPTMKSPAPLGCDLGCDHGDPCDECKTSPRTTPDNPATSGDIGTEWVHQADHPDADRLAKFEASLVESGVDTPGCDCGHDGMGARWHDSHCEWRSTPPCDHCGERGHSFEDCTDGETEAEIDEAMATGIPVQIITGPPPTFAVDPNAPSLTFHCHPHPAPDRLREQHAADVECAIGLNIGNGGSEGVKAARDAVLAVRDRRMEQLQEDLADARMWARHGYELGQTHATWSDYGVAPAWLTEGWPLAFAPGQRPAHPDGTPFRYAEIVEGGWGHCDGCRQWGQWTQAEPHQCPKTHINGPAAKDPRP